MSKYFGKYRAKVVDVKDPERRGRIRVLCPKVLGDFKSAWCEPCIPVAYENGGDYAIPKVNEFVWVEFEEGNQNKPIYTGSLWTNNNSSSPDYNVANRHIVWGACRITMTPTSAIISVGASSITLTGSSIKVSSPRVDLN